MNIVFVNIIVSRLIALKTFKSQNILDLLAPENPPGLCLRLQTAKTITLQSLFPLIKLCNDIKKINQTHLSYCTCPLEFSSKSTRTFTEFLEIFTGNEILSSTGFKYFCYVAETSYHAAFFRFDVLYFTGSSLLIRARTKKML